MAEKKTGKVIELPPDQMAIVECAVERLNDKEQRKTSDQYARAVLPSVAKALEDFCYQSPEFARAIVDCKKTLAECCETIMKKCGSSISDLEVYRRAVQFYLPGSQIDMQMRVIFSDQKSSQDAPKAKSAVILNLLDL